MSILRGTENELSNIKLGSQLGSKYGSQLSLTILIIRKRIGVDSIIQFRDISVTLEI